MIRNGFTNDIDLTPGTKYPPSIIHITIARFAEAVELAPIKQFASELSVNFDQLVRDFRLVNEKKVPMLEYELIKSYALAE